MKLGKLLASIRRELVTKPKKAVLLALLLAAAGWFWWPIVGKIFGKRPPAAEPKVAAAAGAAAPTPAVVPVAAESQSPRTRWNEVVKALQRDPLTRTIPFDPDWPQPFKVTARPQDSVASATDPAGQASALLTPMEAGLVLESVVYGKEQRAVVINGEMYHEGSYVVVAAAAGPPLHFHLVEIKPSSVLLARYGKSFTLEFPKPRLVRSGAPQ